MKAKQRNRPVTAHDEFNIEIALSCLNAARHHLRTAQANNAAAYVGRALKSTQGALRHVRGRLDRLARGLK
jgi:hypothetical protein